MAQYKSSFPGRASHIKLKPQQRLQSDITANPFQWLTPLQAPFPSPVPSSLTAEIRFRELNQPNDNNFFWRSGSMKWQTSVSANAREVARIYICAQVRKTLSLDWVHFDVNGKVKRRTEASCLYSVQETELAFETEQTTACV